MSSSLPQTILPLTASINERDHLTLGGCDTVDLAAEFGTPAYLFDEETIRHSCQEFRDEFQSRYPNSSIAYASKAYLGRALASLLIEEQMELDVVSGGELAIAQSVNFPPEHIHFHGNNKSKSELQQALEYGIGRVVLDNFREIDMLSQLASDMNIDQKVLLRLTPGVDPHTHAYTTTGVIDSKFGFPMIDSTADAALQKTLSAPGLTLTGLHIHLGSPIFDLEPYCEGINVMMSFAAKMSDRYGFQLQEVSPGGGFAIQYLENEEAPSVARYADTIVSAISKAAEAHSLPLPRIIIEPGRSIVARAGVALYRIGASKEVPGIRRYVFVDGGMADNIRPALYRSEYTAVLASRASDQRREKVTIAGKYCESGDILLRDSELPPLDPGDLLAIPASGAYCLPMASNYNAALKPPIIMLRNGQAKLVRHRESYDDLMQHDVYSP